MPACNRSSHLIIQFGRTLSTPGFLTYVRMPKAPHKESRKRGCRDDTGINQELIKEYKCNLFVMLLTL